MFNVLAIGRVGIYPQARAQEFLKGGGGRMWGLFEQRTNKMGLVRLFRLPPQNIWYIQVWGLFEL